MSTSGQTPPGPASCGIARPSGVCAAAITSSRGRLLRGVSEAFVLGAGVAPALTLPPSLTLPAVGPPAVTPPPAVAALAVAPPLAVALPPVVAPPPVAEALPPVP